MNTTEEPQFLSDMARKMMELWVNPALIIMAITVVDTDEEVNEIMSYLNNTTDEAEDADEKLMEMLEIMMKRHPVDNCNV